MTIGLRQFGCFLLVEVVQEGSSGPIWRAVRLGESGIEHLQVQLLKTSLTASESFVENLSEAVKRAVGHPRESTAAVYELGVVGREYYLAGAITKGQPYQRLLDRCDALSLKPPISLLNHIAVQSLMAIDEAFGEGPSTAWVGSSDTGSIWINYDCTVQLGWDALTTFEPNQIDDWLALRAQKITEIVEVLGTALVKAGQGAPGGGVSQEMSLWLRDALSAGETKMTPAALAEGLRAVADPLSDEDATLFGSVFSREQAVERAKERSLIQQLEAMPHGARKVIARANSQIIVNHRRVARTVDLAHVPVAETPMNALYHGDLSHLDMARLLYRYALAKVNGKLEIQGEPGLVTMNWKDGALLRLRSHAPGHTIIDFMVGKGLVDAETLAEQGLHSDADEGALIQTIVGRGQIGHHELFEAMQTYAQQNLMALLDRSQAAYVFTGESMDTRFSFAPEAPITAIMNEALMSRVTDHRIDAFLAPHDKAILVRLEHRTLPFGDLRLTTRQLRVWNAVTTGLTLSEQLLRLTAIPGVNRSFAARMVTLMERLDFLEFQPVEEADAVLSG